MFVFVTIKLNVQRILHYALNVMPSSNLQMSIINIACEF